MTTVSTPAKILQSAISVATESLTISSKVSPSQRLDTESCTLSSSEPTLAEDESEDCSDSLSEHRHISKRNIPEDADIVSVSGISFQLSALRRYSSIPLPRRQPLQPAVVQIEDQLQQTIPPQVTEQTLDVQQIDPIGTIREQPVELVSPDSPQLSVASRGDDDVASQVLTFRSLDDMESMSVLKNVSSSMTVGGIIARANGLRLAEELEDDAESTSMDASLSSIARRETMYVNAIPPMLVWQPQSTNEKTGIVAILAQLKMSPVLKFVVLSAFANALLAVVYLIAFIVFTSTELGRNNWWILVVAIIFSVIHGFLSAASGFSFVLRYRIERNRDLDGNAVGL